MGHVLEQGVPRLALVLQQVRAVTLAVEGLGLRREGDFIPLSYDLHDGLDPVLAEERYSLFDPVGGRFGVVGETALRVFEIPLEFLLSLGHLCDKVPGGRAKGAVWVSASDLSFDCLDH